MLNFLALLLPFKDWLIKGSLVLVAVVSIWGHGYYTANKKWSSWYEAEKARQYEVNKEAEERGRKAEIIIKKEEQQDEQKLQELEREADSDSSASSIVLPRRSVQRLNKL